MTTPAIEQMSALAVRTASQLDGANDYIPVQDGSVATSGTYVVRVSLNELGEFLGADFLDESEINTLIRNAMRDAVTGNTETGIQVVWQSSDNTLDFAVSGAGVARLIEALGGNARLAFSALRNVPAYQTATDIPPIVRATIANMLSGNTESGIDVTFQASDNTLDFEVDGSDVATLLNALAAGSRVSYNSLDNTPAVIPQDEAEAGSATTARLITAQRLNQAITALAPGGSTSGLNQAAVDARVQVALAAAVTGNTETGIAVTYQAADDTYDFVVSGAAVAGLLNALTGNDRLSYSNLRDQIVFGSEFQGDGTDASNIELAHPGLRSITSVLLDGSNRLVITYVDGNGDTQTTTPLTLPAGGTGATTFLGLTDTPAALTANQFVRANAAGDALVFAPANNYSLPTRLRDFGHDLTGEGYTLITGAVSTTTSATAFTLATATAAAYGDQPSYGARMTNVNIALRVATGTDISGAQLWIGDETVTRLSMRLDLSDAVSLGTQGGFDYYNLAVADIGLGEHASARQYQPLTITQARFPYANLTGVPAMPGQGGGGTAVSLTRTELSAQFQINPDPQVTAGTWTDWHNLLSHTVTAGQAGVVVLAAEVHAVNNLNDNIRGFLEYEVRRTRGSVNTQLAEQSSYIRNRPPQTDDWYDSILAVDDVETGDVLTLRVRAGADTPIGTGAGVFTWNTGDNFLLLITLNGGGGGATGQIDGPRGQQLTLWTRASSPPQFSELTPVTFDGSAMGSVPTGWSNLPASLTGNDPVYRAVAYASTSDGTAWVVSAWSIIAESAVTLQFATDALGTGASATATASSRYFRTRDIDTTGAVWGAWVPLYQGSDEWQQLASFNTEVSHQSARTFSIRPAIDRTRIREMAFECVVYNNQTGAFIARQSKVVRWSTYPTAAENAGASALGNARILVSVDGNEIEVANSSANIRGIGGTRRDFVIAMRSNGNSITNLYLPEFNSGQDCAVTIWWR